MSMFQSSVLKSFSQDESLVALRWAKFQEFLSKVDYIKTVKEEKYQDGFLKDVFESCLGYTLDMTNPSNFNLEREKKNETDGKKADGVIYVDEKIVGVIELKAQDTKNLDKIEAQAFNYHASHSNSKYIIISNFDELRFYIDKKTAYEKFSLFNLDYEEFKKLHLLLSFESIKNDIPLKIKEKTASFEQNISKELYKDFSIFRNHLFENIITNNENIDKSTLLRLTQKLCDRIIFILFAEDRGLLTPNTIKEIRLKHSQDGFGDRSMYDYYKLYFNAINEGNERLNIPKYNGGLFSKDELLDSLKIDDNALNMEAQKLSDYDFASEVSVNILGHIFEQSLTDLEEIQANINNTDFDKTKSKRKKDGVFYTPEYITKYIVDNTLGKMCTQKREELNLSNVTAPTNPKKLTKVEQQIKDNLETYKDWLFNLKILDPACGSGAFLNQALEYLIKEHKQLQNDLALMGDLFSSYTVEESVLEHNLYGVDINEDAVEIAKLSLWLRTAQKGRPLTNLADKIKCGNSLISDKSVVENAFVWEEEFKEVFENGGFDVVIGNPPYVSTKQIDKFYREYFWDKYSELLISEMDLYEIFLFDSIKYKLSNNGRIGFITPNSYYTNKSFENLRKYLIEDTHIVEIIDFPYRFFPFEDVNTETSILILKKTQLSDELKTNFSTASKDKINKSQVINDLVKINKKEFFQNNLKISFDNKIIINQTDVLMKLLKSENKFGDYLELHKGWMSIPTKTNINGQVIDKGIFSKEELEVYDIRNYCHKYLEGKDIHRYYFDKVEKYVNIENIDTKTRNWHFSNKIILQRIVGQNKNKIFATYDSNNYVIFPNANLVNIIDDGIDIRFFLSILNSSLISYFYNVYFGESNTNLTKLAFESIPIPNILLTEKEPFLQKANFMINLYEELLTAKQGFLDELKLEKLPTKLQNFETLEFDEFIKEYAKALKRKFTDKLEERNFKNEWKAIFENDKEEVLRIQEEINETDKQIDQMVYKLYDLTEDEINIVERI